MDRYNPKPISPRNLTPKMTFNPRQSQLSHKEQTIIMGVSGMSREISPQPSERNYTIYSATKHYPNGYTPESLSYISKEENQMSLTEDDKSTYQNIERILRNQNNNLKKQNELLLTEINKLRKTNKKYKDLCLGQQIQLQGVREECEAQKQRADEMKDIISQRLMTLEQQCLEDSKLSQQSSVQIEGLTFSNSGMNN